MSAECSSGLCNSSTAAQRPDRAVWQLRSGISLSFSGRSGKTGHAVILLCEPQGGGGGGMSSQVVPRTLSALLRAASHSTSSLLTPCCCAGQGEGASRGARVLPRFSGPGGDAAACAAPGAASGLHQVGSWVNVCIQGKQSAADVHGRHRSILNTEVHQAICLASVDPVETQHPVQHMAPHLDSIRQAHTPSSACMLARGTRCLLLESGPEPCSARGSCAEVHGRGATRIGHATGSLHVC